MTTEKKTEISISVRNLVEFILRSGDIESGFTGSSRAVEGTLAHKKVQNSYDASVYQAEVMLSHSIEYEKYILKISGRADGVLKDDDIIIIDEIKSTTKELNKINEDYNQLHWAQVMIYAYFYALENQLEEIGVQLTYYHLETEKNLKSKRKYTLKELEDYFQSIISQYIYWAEYSYNWTEERNKSIEELNFPHGDYRKGQRKLTVAVYKTVIEEKKLYVQAPTGIGKTISTLFPSIIAMGKKGWEKIFYLTAKTVTQKV
ncbi:MAG: PD-(D/E)XK nuclease family protein, partial [Bacillota bacterium]